MNTPERQTQSTSDLMDGRLHGADLAAALQHLAHDADARASWAAYHVAGDVLRSPDLARGARDTEFVLRLRARLQAEIVLRPTLADTPPAAQPLPTPGLAQIQKDAANQDRFTWKWAAGLASVAAVLVVGWNVAGRLPGSAAEPTAQIASASTTAAEPVMIRDARLDELIQAHRQAGSGSALQMPSGFLRNATFEVEGVQVSAK